MKPFSISQVLIGYKAAEKPGAVSAIRFHRTVGISILGLILVSWVCVGCTGSPQAVRPLRVAINPWPGYEYATLAQVKNYFEEEGVEVRLVELSSLGDCRRAFERGQVDGFFSTTVEVIQSRELSSRCADIVMVADYSDGADLIIAQDDIDSVADLVGKRIAVEAGSINEFILYRSLEIAQVPFESVQVQHIPTWQMASAFHKREVDAVVTYPPVSIELKLEGGGREIFTTKNIPGEVIDVLSFDREIVQTRKSEIDAFIKAFHRAQDYAVTYPEDAYSIMAARERIPVEELRSVIEQGIHVVTSEEQEKFFGSPQTIPGLLKKVRRVLEESGHLNQHSENSLELSQIQEMGEP